MFAAIIIVAIVVAAVCFYYCLLLKVLQLFFFSVVCFIQTSMKIVWDRKLKNFVCRDKSYVFHVAFVLTTHDSDTWQVTSDREVYFQNCFISCNVVAGTTYKIWQW